MAWANKIISLLKIFRDAIIVAATNCGTSVFAAIIIFAIMGFKVKKIKIRDVVSFFEQLDQLEVFLPYSRLPTRIPILVVFQY